MTAPQLAPTPPNYVWIVLTKDPKGVWAIDSVKNNAAAALERGDYVKDTRPGHESFVDRREVHG